MVEAFCQFDPSSILHLNNHFVNTFSQSFCPPFLNYYELDSFPRMPHEAVLMSVRPSRHSLPYLLRIRYRPFSTNYAPFPLLVGYCRLVTQFHSSLIMPLKHTKNSQERSHTLAARLQVCNSPSAILAILQLKSRGLDRSQSSVGR